MKLTGKREKFCRLIAEGKEQLEAYDLAGFSKKQSKRSRISNASKLMQNTDIILTIETHKKEITKNLNLESTITVESQLRVIEAVKQQITKKVKDKIPLTDGEIKSLMILIQEQNKLIGLYAPTKSRIEQTTKVDNETIRALEQIKQAYDREDNTDTVQD